MVTYLILQENINLLKDNSSVISLTVDQKKTDRIPKKIFFKPIIILRHFNTHFLGIDR